MTDRVHSGPGTCVAQVGEEAALTSQLREWLRCVAQKRPNACWPAALPASATWESAEGDRHVITLAPTDLDRLQRIHYRRRRPGARAPTSFSVYLPEGVVEFRATSQEAP